jgi:hypothetical protein
MRSATDATPATPCYTVKIMTVPAAFFLRKLQYPGNYLPNPGFPDYNITLVKAQGMFFDIF